MQNKLGLLRTDVNDPNTAFKPEDVLQPEINQNWVNDSSKKLVSDYAFGTITVGNTTRLRTDAYLVTAHLGA